MTTPTDRWDYQGVVDWLLSDGRLTPDLDYLTTTLAVRMRAAGAPLWRFRLSMRTLHPLVTAHSVVWERDGGTPQKIEALHGLEGRPDYIGSPLAVIARTLQPFRRRLESGLSPSDDKVLHDLRSRGATDYFGLPLPGVESNAAILTAVTDRAGGFSDHDITGLHAVGAALAPVMEAYKARNVAVAVSEAYLGPRTGRQVLDGRITRGDIDRIQAAILISDVRGWTQLNRDVSPEEALSRVNRYFETIGQAIDDNGGEILKFLGDGVLAVFSSDGSGDDTGVCDRALKAAQSARDLAEAIDPPLGIEFGVGLHFGEVLYGNVGSHTRIDFTVLGQAVNIAARIESLSGSLGIPILYSQEFADELNGPSQMVAEEQLKGLDGAVRVFTTPALAP